jgi:Cu+-exporting ATPase
MKEKFNISGMSCAACVARVEKAVSALDGVNSVSVNLLSNSMVAEYDENKTSPDIIISAVSNAGYNASIKSTGVSLPAPDKNPERSIKSKIIISAVFLVILMSVSMGPMLFSYSLPPFLDGKENALTRSLLQFLLCLPVLYLNRVYFEKGFSALIKLNPNMDSLVALGASASVLHGVVTLFCMSHALASSDFEALSLLEHNLYFEGAAMIVTLITVGKFLEARSKRKTGEALSKLIDMSPKTARVERDGKICEVNIQEVTLGDIVFVRAGESIAVDGEVIEGSGEADESAITGESIPVTKNVGEKVIGATILKSGFIRFKATHIGKDTVFSKIIELVENAQSGKAPIARVADKIAGIFVPTVISISIITAAAWLISGEAFSTALTHSISVLVISCPCALGLATPVAITVGTGVGAENGILIKSAETLELLHSIDTVVLDKTGTVTEGKPVMTDVFPIGISREQLLTMACSIEEKSEHPLSRAVIDGALSENITPEPCDDYKTFSGKGVCGTWRGMQCLAGNAMFLNEHGIDTSSADSFVLKVSNEGKTPLFFSIDNTLKGVIAVADTLKKDSREAISLLSNTGKKVIMLTGDNRRTAEGIGKDLKLEKIISDVLPEDKERVIRQLCENGNKVAMVGDGINDAPALVSAHVGFAIGSGTDIARDSSDIILMRNSLMGVYDAINLSSLVIKNIKQNLFWAFFYNCLGIPLAAGVFVPITNWTLTPVFASVAMSLSSLFVVTNALRIKKFKRFNSETDNSREYVTVKIKGMMCNNCVGRVDTALRELQGINNVEVSLKEGLARVYGNVSSQEITNAIEMAGYKVLKIKD